MVICRLSRLDGRLKGRVSPSKLTSYYSVRAVVVITVTEDGPTNEGLSLGVRPIVITGLVEISTGTGGRRAVRKLGAVWISFKTGRDFDFITDFDDGDSQTNTSSIIVGVRAFVAAICSVTRKLPDIKEGGPVPTFT